MYLHEPFDQPVVTDKGDKKVQDCLEAFLHQTGYYFEVIEFGMTTQTYESFNSIKAKSATES
jgi:hypothetical protein